MIASLAVLQINPVVGDIAGNVARIRTACDSLQVCDLIITPELSLTGYPLDDLVSSPDFADAVKDAVLGLAAALPPRTTLVIGAPWAADKDGINNAALILRDGRISDIIIKRELPNYGVFDEPRVFKAGTTSSPIFVGGRKIGIMLCEDMWFPATAGDLKRQGAELLCVMNASPWDINKVEERLKIARQRVSETALPLLYVNCWGGQDDLVFDGHSFIMAADGNVMWQAAGWQDVIEAIDCGNILGNASEQTANRISKSNEISQYSSQDISRDGNKIFDDNILSECWSALKTSLRDYVRKNSFARVVLGLSGGIDSALVATLAVDALGADAVSCIFMPSPYTAAISAEDATALTQALGCNMINAPIGALMEHATTAISPALGGDKLHGLAAENLQARLRGVILMALANSDNALLLATGNKSEMATGYATLYGDMCGGFAPLKDVLKTVVLKLAIWRNRQTDAPIPIRSITRPPSAELRPDQADTDSLPPYPELDAILRGIIEQDLPIAAIIAQGHDAALVEKVARMIALAEYKRRQAPPGTKISPRHLTKDRRYPITCKWRT